VSPSGSFTEVMMGRHQKAWDLVTAPDGNLWFTAGKFGIGRLTHGSDVRIFGLPKDPSTTDLTVGPDGRLWFAEPQNGVVGRFDPRTHRYRTFALPGSTPLPVAVGSGPDGNLWIADPGDRAIVRMTPSGHTRAFPLGAHLGPASVVPGPDGNVWFVAQNSHEVVRIQPDGTMKGYVVPSEPSCQQYPTAITAGSDGAMWFSLPCVPAMGRLQIRTEIPAVRR
jgi:virginiamycin B lyase